MSTTLAQPPIENCIAQVNDENQAPVETTEQKQNNEIFIQEEAPNKENEVLKESVQNEPLQSKENITNSNIIQNSPTDKENRNKENTEIEEKVKQIISNNKENNKENSVSNRYENKTKQATSESILSQLQKLQLQNLQQAKNKKSSAGSKPSKFQPETQVSEVIQVSQTDITFGVVMPGNIFEESLEVTNLTKQSLVVTVQVVCHNKELEEHDEYVYSVRKVTGYDYNERVGQVLAGEQKVQFKVALKVPNLEGNSVLRGSVHIGVQSLSTGPYTIPVNSKVEIPKIVCNKSLYNAETQCSVIKIAIKKGKKQDARIPFQSLSNAQMNLEFDWLEGFESEDAKKFGEPYELHIHPNSLTIQPNNSFMINVVMKNNPQYLGEQPQKGEVITMRKLLYCKIKNTSVFVPFPIILEIY